MGNLRSFKTVDGKVQEETSQQTEGYSSWMNKRRCEHCGVRVNTGYHNCRKIERKCPICGRKWKLSHDCKKKGGKLLNYKDYDPKNDWSSSDMKV